MTKRVLFVSVEPSGDDLAVDVIKECRQKSEDFSALAIGGPSLSRVGLSSPLDVSPLGVVGFVDGLKAYSKAIELADQTVDYAIENQVTAVVLIDAWGFTLRVAQRLKKRAPEIKVIKLIGPQVWATRPGRAKTLAETVDHLLCIHEFEIPFYEPFGLACTAIGNPAISRMETGSADVFRSKYGVSGNDDLLLVLPGSRKTELKRVAPVFEASTKLLLEHLGSSLKVAVLVSPDIRNTDEWAALHWPADTIFVENPDDKADVMSAASVALACSGTVTTELATQKCPMVVGYKLGWVTWAIARLFLMKSKYITLSNIAVDEEIIPELIQTRLTAENVVDQLSLYLTNEDMRAQQKADLERAAIAMGRDKPPAHKIAADTILSLI